MSWDTAATLFRNAITRETWQGAVKAAREPLGQLQSRTQKSATSTTTLPGAPFLGRLSTQLLAAGVVDLMFGALFLVAYARTATSRLEISS